MERFWPVSIKLGFIWKSLEYSDWRNCLDQRGWVGHSAKSDCCLEGLRVTEDLKSLAGDVFNSVIFQIYFHSLLLCSLALSFLLISTVRSRDSLGRSLRRLAQLTVFLYKSSPWVSFHGWFLERGFPACLVTHVVHCQAIMEMNPSTHGSLPRIICRPICAFAANFCYCNICPMVIIWSI